MKAKHITIIYVLNDINPYASDMIFTLILRRFIPRDEEYLLIVAYKFWIDLTIPHYPTLIL